ncbi:MAG: class I SAM-dependent methyltransferase [Candidatus Sumerlaeia bacterium]|nr:class I SAM-dependent methyltransferase [Candidatus Sumerlaeia bacterium]
MDDSPALYQNPDLYNRVFPVDGEEKDFFCRLIRDRAPNGVVVDLGCGTGVLTDALAAELDRPVIGLDRERAMLRNRGGICGCLTRLPLGNHSVAAFVCRLFGVAYAMAGDWATSGPGYTLPLEEIVRCLAPGGIAALEIPMSHRAHKLMGVEETADLDGGIVYTFRYLDILRQTEIGVILDTRIEVQLGLERAVIHAPIHVVIPGNLTSWLKSIGCVVTGYCAPYDIESMTGMPPGDVLRGVVVFQLPGAGVPASSIQTSH